MSGNTAAAPGISIDSRTLRPGDVYYALRGDSHDGHDFVEAALAAGAAAAVVAGSQMARFPAALAPRLRPVADPLRALQAAAREARRGWGGPLIAVTGSAGKTTTKEMIAAALATRWRVLKNEGNLNNHVGVPLTLLRLRPEHQVAVVEMGMNHAGEIAALAAIAEPNVGVFTNVGEAHIGLLGSLEAIAEAKRELAYAIPTSGTLVLNADDARVARFAEGFGGKVVWYTGTGTPRDANAAAAVATAAAFDVAPEAARAAIAAMPALPGRGQVIEAGGITYIHDCYNANPPAMEAMLQVLRQAPAQRRIAVLGEMRELGAASAQLHRRVGAAAAAAGIQALFAVAGDARFLLDGARAAGFGGHSAFCADADAAVVPLRAFLQPGDAVLLKASRAIHLETALNRLTGVG